MEPVSERARAKINLTLRVLGRRSDGYHLLESLVAFADVGDDVLLSPGSPPQVAMTGTSAGAITGRNLVDTALQKLEAADPGLQLGAVEVRKELPIAAGIGGGSADAAAVLRAVRRVNPASPVDWQALAASLGADVPVCFADSAALMWGVGERLEPVPHLPPLPVVLACPMAAAPLEKTRTVFAQLAVPPASSSAPPMPLPAFPDARALVQYMRGIGNDLRAPAHAVMPSSAQAEAEIAVQTGCRYASLSGAGPTSFGVFEDASAAAAAAGRLRAGHPDWWVAATTVG